MSLKKILRNQKGFSLIEILIVIGIMAILAVIIIPRFADTGEDTRVAVNSSNLALLQSAVERYYIKNTKYPTADDTIPGTIVQSKLTTAKYINEEAKNPWETTTDTTKNTLVYKIDDTGNVILAAP